MTDQQQHPGPISGDLDPTTLLEQAVLAGALPPMDEHPIDVDKALAELARPLPGAADAVAKVDVGTQALAQQVADSAASFLLALREISRDADGGGRAISLLLLEISQALLAGAQLGAQRDFTPRAEYQPDIGPETDLDPMRMRLAAILEPVDTYSLVFDPYAPEVVESQLSDDLTSIASDLETGLRHFRQGNTEEALWWWQFSYVSSWGNLAGAALNALLSVVSHDRLDRDVPGEDDVLAVADEMLGGGTPAPR
ncbi:DUF5063 domain-containing protein [Nocardioides sp. IC4_145]|uniref:DUF5063 domain-containing protein n=1 Tax=Nocardioides sp. IC4_145 TaxID=2714037 RepID=UPI001F61BA6C|nr:DUF5063 domain-containing protein [Nocardioides sp. IC4_145]